MGCLGVMYSYDMCFTFPPSAATCQSKKKEKAKKSNKYNALVLPSVSDGWYWYTKAP